MAGLICLIYADTIKKLDALVNMVNRAGIQFQKISRALSDENPAELCMQYQPNLVIIDIGASSNRVIHLMQAFRKADQLLHMVVSVDYRRFTFAHEDMDLEAVDFVSNPVQEEILTESLKRFVDRHEEMRKEKTSVVSLQKLLNEHIPIIRQHYLSMLMRRTMPAEEEVLQKFQTLQIDCAGPYYVVAVMRLSNERINENFEAVSFLVLSTMKAMLKAAGFQVYIFFDSIFRVNCLIGLENQEMEPMIEEVLNHFSARVYDLIGLLPVIGVGHTVTTTMQIHQSYLAAEDALQYYRTDEMENVILFRNIGAMFSRQRSLDRSIDQLVMMFGSQRLEELERYLTQRILNWDNKDAEGLKEFSIKYAMRLFVRAEKMGMNVAEFPIIPQMMFRLYNVSAPKEVLEILLQLTKLPFSMEQKADMTGNHLIDMACQYLSEHLAEKDLDLAAVSDYVGLSRVYFCKLFHKNLGINFGTYLRIQRIEKAKQLLMETNLKAYEIADIVGFASPKYFSSVFKQSTGLTPLEYQKRQSLEK